ncbi:hypothetical protein SNEBB_003716 [Seison nebaliae]|nr:hypothetical protein SNEBB_003716 [Seison nebaliae]
MSLTINDENWDLSLKILLKDIDNDLCEKETVNGEDGWCGNLFIHQPYETKKCEEEIEVAFVDIFEKKSTRQQSTRSRTSTVIDGEYENEEKVLKEIEKKTVECIVRQNGFVESFENLSEPVHQFIDGIRQKYDEEEEKEMKMKKKKVEDDECTLATIHLKYSTIIQEMRGIERILSNLEWTETELKDKLKIRQILKNVENVDEYLEKKELHEIIDGLEQTLSHHRDDLRRVKKEWTKLLRKSFRHRCRNNFRKIKSSVFDEMFEEYLIIFYPFLSTWTSKQIDHSIPSENNNLMELKKIHLKISNKKLISKKKKKKKKKLRVKSLRNRLIEMESDDENGLFDYTSPFWMEKRKNLPREPILMEMESNDDFILNVREEIEIYNSFKEQIPETLIRDSIYRSIYHRLLFALLPPKSDADKFVQLNDLPPEQPLKEMCRNVIDFLKEKKEIENRLSRLKNLKNLTNFISSKETKEKILMSRFNSEDLFKFLANGQWGRIEMREEVKERRNSLKRKLFKSDEMEISQNFLSFINSFYFITVSSTSMFGDYLTRGFDQFFSYWNEEIRIYLKFKSLNSSMRKKMEFISIKSTIIERKDRQSTCASTIAKFDNFILDEIDNDDELMMSKRKRFDERMEESYFDDSDGLFDYKKFSEYAHEMLDNNEPNELEDTLDMENDIVDLNQIELLSSDEDNMEIYIPDDVAEDEMDLYLDYVPNRNSSRQQLKETNEILDNEQFIESSSPIPSISDEIDMVEEMVNYDEEMKENMEELNRMKVDSNRMDYNLDRLSSSYSSIDWDMTNNSDRIMKRREEFRNKTKNSGKKLLKTSYFWGPKQKRCIIWKENNEKLDDRDDQILRERSQKQQLSSLSSSSRCKSFASFGYTTDIWKSKKLDFLIDQLHRKDDNKNLGKFNSNSKNIPKWKSKKKTEWESLEDDLMNTNDQLENQKHSLQLGKKDRPKKLNAIEKRFREKEEFDKRIDNITFISVDLTSAYDELAKNHLIYQDELDFCNGVTNKKSEEILEKINTLEDIGVQLTSTLKNRLERFLNDLNILDRCWFSIWYTYGLYFRLREDHYCRFVPIFPLAHMKILGTEMPPSKQKIVNLIADIMGVDCAVSFTNGKLNDIDPTLGSMNLGLIPPFIRQLDDRNNPHLYEMWNELRDDLYTLQLWQMTNFLKLDDSALVVEMNNESRERTMEHYEKLRNLQRNLFK